MAARVRAAIDQLYRRDSRRIFATLIRLLGDFERAEETLSDAFRAAMPGQQNATNARRRVETRLSQIRSGGGALLPVLAAIATARGAAPGAVIEGLTFRDGTLELRITAPDAAALDAIGRQLRAANWQADILGGSANGDAYRGRLQIRRAGA